MKDSILNPENQLKHKPTVLLGILIYIGYLTVFFTTWTINEVDYTRIAESIETTKLWYAFPTLFGSLFLVLVITGLGWWKIVLFESSKAGPKWAWILPGAIILVIVVNLLRLDGNKLSPELLLWSSIGAMGVGFGEEMITRGSMIAGLRSRFSEQKVWLISTLLFSALHVPNVIFGLPLEAMPFQVILTFIMGSGLYVIRRISGTLIFSMILHGLWDSSLFITETTGGVPAVFQFVVYPIAIVCLFAVLRNTYNPKL